MSKRVSGVLKKWQHHIRQTHASLVTVSWCGEPLSEFDWCYVNIDHAAYSAPVDRMQPCPACVEQVTKALAGGT